MVSGCFSQRLPLDLVPRASSSILGRCNDMQAALGVGPDLSPAGICFVAGCMRAYTAYQVDLFVTVNAQMQFKRLDTSCEKSCLCATSRF
mgnify:CR=1 FL=1